MSGEVLERMTFDQIIEAAKKKQPVDGEYVDVRGQDFSGMDLTGAKLYSLDCSGCDFSNTILEDATIIYNRFDGADFKGANMADARLDYANSFKGANFEDAILDRVLNDHTFDGRTLDFTGAKFIRTSLIDANLSGATYSDITFHDVRFKSTFMEKSVFSNVKFVGINGDDSILYLDGVQAKNVEIFDSEISIRFDSSGNEGSFTDLTITCSNISNSYFGKATLKNVIISWSNISYVEFDDAKLINVKIDNSDATDLFVGENNINQVTSIDNYKTKEKIVYVRTPYTIS